MLIWCAWPDICGCYRRISWRHFRNRILNIHPSLLPAFPGLESQRQALEHGAKFSGCTVHFVDENLDAGPIVLQACVPIEDSDTPETLAERILREEHRIYTEAVRIVLEGRYRIEGRRVLLNAPKGLGGNSGVRKIQAGGRAARAT